jgi:hypothetical protein
VLDLPFEVHPVDHGQTVGEDVGEGAMERSAIAVRGSALLVSCHSRSDAKPTWSVCSHAARHIGNRTDRARVTAH